MPAPPPPPPPTYSVPVPYHSQDTAINCGYASAMMLLDWRGLGQGFQPDPKIQDGPMSQEFMRKLAGSMGWWACSPASLAWLVNNGGQTAPGPASAGARTFSIPGAAYNAPTTAEIDRVIAAVESSVAGNPAGSPPRPAVLLIARSKGGGSHWVVITGLTDWFGKTLGFFFHDPWVKSRMWRGAGFVHARGNCSCDEPRSLQNQWLRLKEALDRDGWHDRLRWAVQHDSNSHRAGTNVKMWAVLYGTETQLDADQSAPRRKEHKLDEGRPKIIWSELTTRNAAFFGELLAAYGLHGPHAPAGWKYQLGPRNPTVLHLSNKRRLLSWPITPEPASPGSDSAPHTLAAVFDDGGELIQAAVLRNWPLFVTPADIKAAFVAGGAAWLQAAGVPAKWHDLNGVTVSVDEKDFYPPCAEACEPWWPLYRITLTRTGAPPLPAPTLTVYVDSAHRVYTELTKHKLAGN